ncbi:hypothetical protein DFJ73DRAFT_828980 [Zopfochytrium polystomum]|nr:hypothetical protein DFJ73DRAFT_828980 [Zopfochytrium polystomum]
MEAFLSFMDYKVGQVLDRNWLHSAARTRMEPADDEILEPAEAKRQKAAETVDLIGESSDFIPFEEDEEMHRVDGPRDGVVRQGEDVGTVETIAEKGDAPSTDEVSPPRPNCSLGQHRTYSPWLLDWRETQSYGSLVGSVQLWHPSLFSSSVTIPEPKLADWWLRTLPKPVGRTRRAVRRHGE